MIPLFAPGLQPETAAYRRLPSPTLSQQTVDTYIKAVKYASGVTLASTTLNISNPATSPLFLTNSSVDLRWTVGFYITLTETTNTLKVLATGAGSAETSSEAVVNGTMEADSDWGDQGAVTSNTRSSEQAHGGTYSRKIVGDNGTGANQNIGIGYELYKINSCWLYVTAGSAYLYIGGAWSVLGDTKTAAEWANSIATPRYYTGLGGGVIVLRSGTTPSTFYADDVSISKILTPSATGVTFSSPTVTGAFNYNAASYTATVTLT